MIPLVEDADDEPLRRQATAREWTAYVVSMTLLVSGVASFVLVVALAFGRVSGGLLGGPIGAALVALWQNRPGGAGDAEDDEPRRTSDRVAVWAVPAAAVADLVVVVVVPLTGRLGTWAAWTAAALLLLHVVMAAVVLRRVRERTQHPPPGYDDPSPRHPDLRWRTVPEPLRSAGWAFVVLGFVMIAIAVASVVSGWDPGGAVFAVCFGGLLVAAAVVCVVLALDLRGCARAMARRVQLKRRSSRFPIADSALPRHVLLWRVGGAVCAVVVLAALAFIATGPG